MVMGRPGTQAVKIAARAAAAPPGAGAAAVAAEGESMGTRVGEDSPGRLQSLLARLVREVLDGKCDLSYRDAGPAGRSTPEGHPGGGG